MTCSGWKNRLNSGADKNAFRGWNKRHTAISKFITTRFTLINFEIRSRQMYFKFTKDRSFLPLASLVLLVLWEIERGSYLELFTIESYFLSTHLCSMLCCIYKLHIYFTFSQIYLGYWDSWYVNMKVILLIHKIGDKPKLWG